MITRRHFIQKGILTATSAFILPYLPKSDNEIVMTINGPLPADQMNFTLTHEHVLADFIGAAQYSKARYNADEVYKTALPFLLDLKKKGCSTFIDCSPAYLGRDVQILKRLANATGLNIMTNTGYYGAVSEKFLPKHAYTESAQQLANRWTDEFRNGIEGTDIKPGFIKTSVDNAPLTTVQRKLIEAAGLTHLATGITIAVHTGNGLAAIEQLEILRLLKVSPSARIWVHAQNETDKQFHINAARNKSWVSFDGVNPETISANVEYLQNMKDTELLSHVLVSQDSGWYNVGESGGGNFKPYTCIFEQFIPALIRKGFTDGEVDRIFKTNPAKALAIRVRKL
jgi:predicted metal-dependent phosphotriesterase family hydrolase